MILLEYKRIRKQTEFLCENVPAESMVLQAEEFASPGKWHLGHTTWFFETFLLKEFVPGYEVFNASYAFIFNSYYETLGQRVKRNQRGILFDPPLQQIMQYRAYIDLQVELYFSAFQASALSVIELGLQHEQQHQELLCTDIKYLYAQHPFHPPCPLNGITVANKYEDTYHMLPVSEGTYPIGYNGSGFCFDNEKPAHPQYISGFEIMNRPVTNGEYIAFIEAGGYKDFRWWLSEGWTWIQSQEIQLPLYWQKLHQQYMHYTFNGMQPVDPNEPLVHINYFEADAFARWKEMSLPTEFEWEVAANIHPDSCTYQVWEWTQSAYLPYPGYSTPMGAIGEYNGKFMINQMVLRGGSIVTPAGHSRMSYRNFFHPHLRWQYSGIRLVKHNKPSFVV